MKMTLRMILTLFPTILFFHLVLLLLLLLVLDAPEVNANPHSRRLYQYLLDRWRYNRLIRPVTNVSEKVNVSIGLKLAQLIDVDEKNQIMTTNVWVSQEWHDSSLRWNPKDFGDVEMIHVPANSIWNPDIVLYNTADGVYEMTSGTKAVLLSSGLVRWKPPASFRSTCLIDVTYFPFDEQQCGFQLGSWTYNINEVDIRHVWQTSSSSSSSSSSSFSSSSSTDYFPPSDDSGHISVGIDLTDFYRSVEWDIMAVPAHRSIRSYAGSKEPFPQWTFNVTLKRKFLFYTVNLIIPLMSHAFITVLVFYIPAASTEKMSLSINILLSLTVFFLMLVEIIPPTSVVVPLLGRYLIFTLILVSSSVIITVITYNVHFRSSATHRMSDWTRKVFLYWLPRLLRMRRPVTENRADAQLQYLHLCTCFGNRCAHRGMAGGAPADPSNPNSTNHARGVVTSTSGGQELRVIGGAARSSGGGGSGEGRAGCREVEAGLSTEVTRANEGALYIANHLKEEDEFYRTMEDWKYVALVIDRIFLWIYAIVCLCGTIAIICKAPMLYDTRTPIVHHSK